MRREVEYFEKPGPENVVTCINLVVNLVSEGYQDVVVASTSGQTGLLAARSLKGKGANLVVVGHNVGFREPNQREFSEEARGEILALGGHVYIGTILTHSLETGLAAKFSGTYPTILIANTLRRLGHGIKVCCEIVMEACDAGLIPEGKDVLAVGGTAYGADTVCIISSYASKRFLQLKIRQILAKPKDW